VTFVLVEGFLSTAAVDFSHLLTPFLKGDAAGKAEALGNLTKSRDLALNTLFLAPSKFTAEKADAENTAFLKYLSECASMDQPLFTWSSLFQEKPFRTDNEVVMVLSAKALWLTARAAFLVSEKREDKKEQVEEADLEAHRCLTTASAIFEVAAESCKKAGDGAALDTHPNVLIARSRKALAEAQEVALGRAVQRQSSGLLLASLCSGCSHHFRLAAMDLAFLPQQQQGGGRGGRLKKYLEIKAAIFLARAYHYHAVHLEEVNRRGDAVTSCKRAVELLAPLPKASEQGVDSLSIPWDKATRPLLTLSSVASEALAAAEALFRGLERRNWVVDFQKPPAVPVDLPEALFSSKKGTFAMPAEAAEAKSLREAIDTEKVASEAGAAAAAAAGQDKEKCQVM
jgi:hypothetical protein